MHELEARRRLLRTVTQVALGAAVIAVCAQISIPQPFSSIPVTLQVLGVFLVAAVLGPAQGALTVTVYLLVGLVGVPVFTQMRAGPGALFGATGGYLVGFLPMAVLTGWLTAHASKAFVRVGAMLAGLVSLYFFGAAWYAFSAGVSFVIAMQATVLPFIAPDLLKLAAAAYIAPALRRALRR